MYRTAAAAAFAARPSGAPTRRPCRLIVATLFTIGFLVPPVAVRAQDDVQQRNARVDSIFASWDTPATPGCAVGVYRDGASIYLRGYGMADLERHVPITPHTVFDIGSTSKQFAAAAVVLLAHDGKLSLDDDVRRHVPELPSWSRPITIRHLLHHTSGLRDYIGLLTLGGARIDDVTTPQDALDAIVRQKALNFDPGDEQLYSNSGYFLLSIIIERVAGESLRDFAKSRIFEPLGMERTHYLGSYDDVVPDRALAYAPREGGYRTDVSRWVQLGDGAVFTTVEDLLQWHRNYLDPVVGGTGMLDELHARGVLTNGDTLSYALGLVHGSHRGARTVSHGGAWGGYRAEFVRFPEQRFSVATLCNLGSINPSPLALRVADVFLEDVLEPRTAAAPAAHAAVTATVELPATALSEVAGAYRNPSSRALFTFVVEDGRLFLTGPGRFEMRPISAAEFELIGAPVVATAYFPEPQDGEARRMRWQVGGQEEPSWFDRLDIVVPDEAELAAYAGSYYSEELQATFTLTVTDGALVVSRRGADPQPLRPLVRDEFMAGGATIRFSRSEDGAVVGYLLDIGRVRNLGFERVQPHR